MSVNLRGHRGPAGCKMCSCRSARGCRIDWVPPTTRRLAGSPTSRTEAVLRICRARTQRSTTWSCVATSTRDRFGSTGGHLSDDFDELHRWLGISRELYDDAMAWNSRGGDWAEQQRLLRRLRKELPDRIEVPPARERPPREVVLLQLRVAGAAGQRQLSEKRRPGRDEPEPLPLTEQDLVDEVAVWLDRRRSFIRGTDENAAAHHAWEDQATDLCRRLGEAWGPDYAVRII